MDETKNNELTAVLENSKEEENDSDTDQLIKLQTKTRNKSINN